MKIIYEIPHVTLFCTEKDELKLQIEDSELFDTFDDILTEQFNIVDYYYSTDEKQEFITYMIHFLETVDIDRLIEVVKSIEKDEVERIFRLNNHPVHTDIKL